MPLNPANPVVISALKKLNHYVKTVKHNDGDGLGALALAALVVDGLKIPGFSHSCFLLLGKNGILIGYDEVGKESVLMDLFPPPTHVKHSFKYDGLTVNAATVSDWVKEGLDKEYLVQPCNADDQMGIDMMLMDFRDGEYGQEVKALVGDDDAPRPEHYTPGDGDASVTSALSESTTGLTVEGIPIIKARPIPMPEWDPATMGGPYQVDPNKRKRVTETKFYRRQQATKSKKPANKRVCPGWRLKIKG